MGLKVQAEGHTLDKSKINSLRMEERLDMDQREGVGGWQWELKS